MIPGFDLVIFAREQGMTNVLLLLLLLNQFALYQKCVKERSEINKWIRECFAKELEEDRKEAAARCVIEKVGVGK